jgi:hypothetical protein
MLTCRYGGSNGTRHEFHDRDDLVVIRTTRRGARHDVSPLGPQAHAANAALEPLFGFAAAGVGLWKAPEGGAEELAATLDADPAVQFAGRGLRDAHGSPIVYTENVFVRFADDADRAACREAVAATGLALKRELGFARNAFFAEAPPRTGRRVFELADELLDPDDVELCHPELIREISWNAASAQQWHLQTTEVGGVPIDAHASVVAAWELTRGEATVIAVIDDGVDIDHEEFAFEDKIVFRTRSAARAATPPARRGQQSRHGLCGGRVRRRAARRERRRASRPADAPAPGGRPRLDRRGGGLSSQRVPAPMSAPLR